MKTRTTMRQRWLPMALVPLFSVAVLAGCSSDDDDDPADEDTTPVVADANNDGTPDAFQVLDPFNATAELVDTNADGVDDRDVDMDGIDDRDANENGIADQYESPADATATAADENGNSIDDSFEVEQVGGADDADGDGVNDAAAALLAGGTATAGTTTTGETTGTTTGDTGGETTGTDTTGDTAGDTTGGTTAGETTGGTTAGETTGGTTAGETTGGTTTGGTSGPTTGTLGDITFGDENPELSADLSWDGTRLTGTVTAPDAQSVALYSGIAASSGNVMQLIELNGSAPTFFMPNPLSDAENQPIFDNMQSGNLFLQVTTANGQNVRSIQLLPPGSVVTALFTALNPAEGSDLNSNGAGFINVNTSTGDFVAVATVNINVDDVDANGNTVSVAAAHIHSGSVSGPVIIPLNMDSSTSFSAQGVLDADQLDVIQQNNGWFNVHENDGTTPGANFVFGQIIFSQ